MCNQIRRFTLHCTGFATQHLLTNHHPSMPALDKRCSSIAAYHNQEYSIGWSMVLSFMMQATEIDKFQRVQLAGQPG